LSKVSVLLINGSPRKYGGTFKLLKVAEAGVIDAGGEVKWIHLIDYNIKPCIGCVSDDQKLCKFPCIIKDDEFNKLGEEILKADGLIIATPIYWYNVSPLVKNLVDRMTSFENMILHLNRSLCDGKTAGFIAVGADSGAIMTLANLMIVMNSMGFHVPPWAIAFHQSEDDVLMNKSAVIDSYNVGYNVAIASMKLRNLNEWYRVPRDLESIISKALKEAELYTEQRTFRLKKMT